MQATFDSLLAFRHMHGAAHGCSDFYFICLMWPLSAEIRMCTRELADCRWMPVRVSSAQLSELCVCVGGGGGVETKLVFHMEYPDIPRMSFEMAYFIHIVHLL